MKAYSFNFDKENFASARLEGVDASFKDLAEVCGRIRNKKISVAIDFLQKVSVMDIPVLFKRHNTKLGHRREIGGRKGRYPQKAAKIVLKTLQSAISNGLQKGFDEMIIAHVAANKKYMFPRVASKGRRSRSFFETARIEVVLKALTHAPKKPESKKVENKESKEVVEKPVQSSEVKQVESTPKPTELEQNPPVVVPKKAEKPKVKLKLKSESAKLPKEKKSSSDNK